MDTSQIPCDTYEAMHWEPELFKLYPEPKEISNEDLILELRSKLTIVCANMLHEYGYIKDIRINGAYVFTYLRRNCNVAYDKNDIAHIACAYKYNLKPLYNSFPTLFPLHTFDEIVVEPYYTLLFKSNKPIYLPKRPYVYDIDEATQHFENKSNEYKQLLLEASALTNEELMNYLRGCWLNEYILIHKKLGYVKDIKIQSAYTFEYLRRNRIGIGKYNVDQLYNLVVVGNIWYTKNKFGEEILRYNLPVPWKNIISRGDGYTDNKTDIIPLPKEIVVEPNYTIVFKYEYGWL